MERISIRTSLYPWEPRCEVTHGKKAFRASVVDHISPPPPPVIITENDVFLSVSNSAICHIYHKITEWRAAIHGAAKSQTRLSD